jgi:hypothetical protein
VTTAATSILTAASDAIEGQATGTSAAHLARAVIEAAAPIIRQYHQHARAGQRPGRNRSRGRSVRVDYALRAVSMKGAAQAVADAHEVVVSGLPGNVDPHVRAAVYAVVVRKFLDNEYARDLTMTWQPEGLA